ncbi:universal stress protein [Bacillus haynesii]|uniref:universal stress protein n=1 Tax=Bacillus haynesii TaxID=1925021 RepID=UPI00227E95F5|nr:universal stress protein [Bacillus haynesii]MCY8214739.1 universal stress protein [Bacillus haynesii]MCY8380363.1 universal stress protein [Bacillus haynesii]MCY8609551.1 universal stress protein [Bacillus haynesii]MEC0675543.1 universal stress protein [Bacillus haynesii]
MYKKILIAVDGSAHSERSADHAINMAKLVPEAEVELIYVLDYSKSKSEVLHRASLEELENARINKLKNVEEKFKTANVSYQITMKHGEPGPTIVSYANDNGFDMVIVGSRGLNSLQEMVLGSVSHKVAKRVNCPVMIVK